LDENFCGEKVLPSVNFINVLSACFLYESPFFDQTLLEKSTFLRKTCEENVDEIDYNGVGVGILRMHLFIFLFQFQFKIVFLQFF